MTISNLVKSISKKEWLWLLLVLAIFSLIILLPPLVGAIFAPTDYQISGRSFLSPGDLTVYLSYLQQAKAGEIIFSDLFTSEQINFIAPWWLILGQLSRLIPLSIQWIFILGKLLPLPLLLISAYLVISYFISDKKWRLITFLSLCFASGLSALITPFFLTASTQPSYQWPLDLWVAESNFFLTAYYSSHLSLALALFLLVILFFFLAVNNHRWLYFLLAGVTNSILFIFHPYNFFTLISITVVGFIYLLLKNFWRWPLNMILKLTMYLYLSSLPLLYYFWLNFTNPYYLQRSWQNICPSPNFIFTFLGYGVWMILAVAGAFLILRIKKLRTEKNCLLVIWAIIQGICLYLPLNFERRLNLGWLPALVILTMIFLIFIRSRKKIQQKFLWTMLLPIFLLAGFTTTLVNAGRDFAGYLTAHQYYYLTPEYQELKIYLQTNLDPKQSLILAPRNFDNFLPGDSGLRVYYGHGHETLNYEQKMTEAAEYFIGQKSPTDLDQFCLQRNISHLIITTENNFDRSALNNNWQLIFSNTTFEVYQLTPLVN